jgi:hypothetical protein
MYRYLKLPCLLLTLALSAAAWATDTQTLVLFFHGEKPPGDLGQLNCQGLNRALALPRVLRQRYGRPDYLFAPNPAVSNHGYNYVRPLATIEPSAIALGLPVNTAFGYNDIAALQRELMQPRYRHATIWIAWEHVYLTRLAQNLLASNQQDPSQVAKWRADDFDGIAVITIQRDAEQTRISYRHDQQGLNPLPLNCPALAD